MIILDFDGVMFDYRRFKRDYRRTLRRQFGISHKTYDQTYAAAKTAHKGIYHHATHLDIMRKKISGLSRNHMERAARDILAYSAQYLYRDARPFLSHWKKKERPLVLVSHGFLPFQGRKIRRSGIGNFFQSVAVTDDTDKTNVIKEIIRRFRPASAVFVDDKKVLVDAVKKRFPAMLVIQLVRSKHYERSARADAIVANLAAARRFIDGRIARRVPGVRGY